jgi:hypothetical protein
VVGVGCKECGLHPAADGCGAETGCCAQHLVEMCWRGCFEALRSSEV